MSVLAPVLASIRASFSTLSILPSALRAVVPSCLISTSCSSSFSFAFSCPASFVLFHLDHLSNVLTCISFGGSFCHFLLTISCVPTHQTCVSSKDNPSLFAIMIHPWRAVRGGLTLLTSTSIKACGPAACDQDLCVSFLSWVAFEAQRRLTSSSPHSPGCFLFCARSDSGKRGQT